MKKVVFVSPKYNASTHLNDLINSMNEQKNPNWKHIIIDDMSTDGSFDMACKLIRDYDNFEIRKNQEKNWALKNVVKVAREYQDDPDVIIAVVDADDELCNENTVNLLIDGYSDSVDTVWTSHTWDINGLNISKPLPNNEANPYQVPWCTSHLKTFRSSSVPETRFVKSLNISSATSIFLPFNFSVINEAEASDMAHPSPVNLMSSIIF